MSALQHITASTAGRKPVRFLYAAVTALLIVLMATAYPAAADGEGLSIDHTEQSGDTLHMLVSVPRDAAVDLDSISVSLNGAAVPARAETASDTSIGRTAVLAIDTSNSMRGKRIAGAIAAATAFLDTVPPDVRVGIVTFDNDVVVRQEPGLDRAKSREVLASLTLARNTAVFDGIRKAVDVASSVKGQHQVLVLSDGEDTTGTPLDPLVEHLSDSKTKVDIVALQLNQRATQVMTTLAEAGGGTLIPSGSPAELRTIFEHEATQLRQQVLVTVDLPTDLAAKEVTAAVGLTADGHRYTAAPYLTLDREAGDSTAPAGLDMVARAGHSWLALPGWALYAGVGALGLAAFGFVAMLFTKEQPTLSDTVDSQLTIYGARASAGMKGGRSRQSGGLGDQARAIAEKALAANRGFEARLARRLEGAAVPFKTPEWFLLHLGIAFGAATVGLLISRGNLVVAVMFFAFGVVGPWLYLGFRHARRLKAFDTGLADTLQLMAGSLSAGLSLQQSMDTIVAEGSEPTTSEFKRVIVEARLGLPIEDALEALAERMESKDFGWVVMAIRIQREVGGNLAELLTTVSETIREREFLRRHVRALSAEGRLSAWILGGLPPMFLLYLTLTKPTYVQPLYTTPIGWLMLIAMTILLSVGIVWMSKVAKVDV